MRHVFLLIFLTLSLLGIQTASAQPFRCGTMVTPEEVAAEKASLKSDQQKTQFLPTTCFNKTLSVSAHVFMDSLGNPGMTAADVAANVAGLNAWFAPICISFQVCTVEFIPDYKYDIFLRTTEQDEIKNKFYIPNTINIYYVKKLFISPGNEVAGYAFLPGGPDMIVLKKPGGAIVHEMGHFFGLYHTFETSFGLELVNGTNCASAGDLVCDTPADPGLANTPPPDCNLSPGTKDANNEWYVPHIGNVMSYYTQDCTCFGFTRLQYDRMASRYRNARFYLW